MNYLLIFIPLIAMVLVNLLPKKIRPVSAFLTLLLILAAQSVFAALAPFGIFHAVGAVKMERIFGFHLVIDNLSLLLILSAGIVGFTALMTAWHMIESEDERFNFTSLLFILLIGMNGISMLRDLFSLYVFIEAIAVSTFILILLQRAREAYEGALKYLILSVTASALMLTSIALFIMFCGGTSFEAIRISLASYGILAKIAIALFICGLFIKGGLVPFHGWLADAYSSAPAPVSVILAGVVTKASGIFTLIRVLTSVIGFSLAVKELLLVVGAISILVGALAALGQKDIKRMLAYSSISQMGYIMVALGCGTKLGLLAAAFHFLNHAIFKSQLFANAAAVEQQTGTRDLTEMGGLAQRMPVTGVTSLIASLSTAGIPPLSGFWSKLLIIIALWVSGNQFYAVLALLASILTLAYFLYLQRAAFFGEVSSKMTAVTEPQKAGMLIPVVLLSSITVGLGLAFPFVIRYFVR